MLPEKMLKNVTSPEKNVKELELLIENDAFKAACDKAYRKKAASISVPGFRKGKAPKAIVEKMYGKEIFYDDAINDLLPELYTSAVKEAGISPVGRPDFNVESIDENGVVIKAKTFVKPDVVLKEYKGLKAEKKVEAVTDKDVDAEIARVRERNGREADVEGRPAKNGDIAVIDFDGYTDGKQFDGGKGENYNLKLGSGQFIPGFEDQIIGHNVGDKFDINVEFPKEYQAEELAGKPAVFKIVIHALKETILPELDDEFAKDVSEFDTLSEYKADVKAKIEKDREHHAEHEVEGQLVDALIANLEADIPECMFEDEEENFLRDYDSRLQMQGLNLDMYLKYTGSTIDDVKKQFRPQAERQVKTNLALEKIVELEKLEVTDADVDAKAEELAKEYNMQKEEVLKAVSKEALENDLRLNKAVDLIKASAVIKKVAAKKTAAAKKTETEAPAEEKKTTAKKTAAKKTAEKADKKPEEAKPAAKKPAAKKTAASEASEENKPAAKKPAAKKTTKKGE